MFTKSTSAHKSPRVANSSTVIYSPVFIKTEQVISALKGSSSLTTLLELKAGKRVTKSPIYKLEVRAMPSMPF